MGTVKAAGGLVSGGPSLCAHIHLAGPPQDCNWRPAVVYLRLQRSPASNHLIPKCFMTNCPLTYLTETCIRKYQCYGFAPFMQPTSWENPGSYLAGPCTQQRPRPAASLQVCSYCIEASGQDATTMLFILLIFPQDCK